MNNFKSPLFIGLFLIVAIIIGIFFTFPKYQEWLPLSKQITQLQSEITSQSAYFDSLKNTSDELKNYQDKVSKINSALPDNPSLSALSAFLNEKSSQNGLVLSKFVKSATVKSKDIQKEITSASAEEGATETGLTASTEGNLEIKETTIVLALTGPYFSFRNFLDDLEKSSRLIEIEEVSLSPASDKGEDIFNFNVRLKVYSY